MLACPQKKVGPSIILSLIIHIFQMICSDPHLGVSFLNHMVVLKQLNLVSCFCGLYLSQIWSELHLTQIRKSHPEIWIQTVILSEKKHRLESATLSIYSALR